MVGCTGDSLRRLFWVAVALVLSGSAGAFTPWKCSLLRRPLHTHTPRQVLMCVREVLREHYRKQGHRIRVPPPAATCLELRQHLEQLGDAVYQLGLWDSVTSTELPLPPGTLIDGRYRVLGHRVTAGLGSYAGQYSYVCADEMPVAPPLGRRARDLLRHSLCDLLRRCLTRLWDGLCETAAGVPSQKEWDQAFKQVLPACWVKAWVNPEKAQTGL